MIRRAFLVLLACSALVPALAWAGPNAGGTIIAHDADFIVNTDYSTCCGLGTPPPSCELADINLEGAGGYYRLWKVYAAFPDGSSPRLKAMCFGVHYDPVATITMFGPCVGDLNNGGGELAGPGWPGNDTGTAIVFQYPQTTQLVECYWFLGYDYYGIPAIFQLRDHPDPVLGGNFADDSIPSILDPITGYGSMGFNTPGEVACPEGGPAIGACCLCDGTCLEIAQAECDSLQGIWIPDLPCDPNPCPAPLPGACCYPDGRCEYVCDWQCPTGDWHEGVPCEPQNPCLPPNPVRNSTWGGIKSMFH